jgi:hypothetical protein
VSPGRLGLSRRRAARFLVLLAVQLTLVFALLEAALRWIGPRHAGLNGLLYIPSVRTDFDRIGDLPTLMRASVEGYRPREQHGDFVYNSRSMRTREYTGEKKPGVYRIAVFGDSFAHGSGGTPYRQMWTTRLEGALKEHREVEVFSLGVGGVGPGFELRLWELERELLRADGVVVGFFVGNDFTDERPETPWRESAVRQHSLVVRLIGNAARLWRERALADQWIATAAETPPGTPGGTVADPHYVRDPNRRKLSDQALLGIEGRLIQICLGRQRAWFERRAREVLQVLARFHAEVTSDGSRFLVLLIPDLVQVDDALRARVLEQLGVAAADVEVDCPQRLLTRLLDERGIESLDLLPLFRERAPSEPLYWLGDTHWNVAGNALAAEALARRVAGWIPEAKGSAD